MGRNRSAVLASGNRVVIALRTVECNASRLINERTLAAVAESMLWWFHKENSHEYDL